MLRLGLTIHSRYCLDPLQNRKTFTPEEKILQRLAFRETSLQYKRELLKNPDSRDHVEVDARGEPVYREERDGRLVMIITRISKKTGERCGNL